MSAATAPHAARVIFQQVGGNSTALSPERNFQSVAKNLYPRLALFETLAGFKDSHRRREQSDDDVFETRRDFLDSFAYLCDIAKGGATVTATGLQKLPLSNILWLAANEGIREDVKLYAEDILQKLKQVQYPTQEAVQDHILHLVVEKCNPRIEAYRHDVQKHARNCRMQLRQESRNDIVRNLRSKLKKLSEPPPNMSAADLVDLCYAMRGDEVDEIRRRINGPEDDFSKLAHYIGRLGATRSSVNAIVRAAIRLPAVRKISAIRAITAPDPRVVTIDPEDMSPYEIVRAICKDSTSQNPIQIQSALSAIVNLDIPFDNKIRAGLASRKNIITRVHAELQIADQFSRHQYMEFVDNDKYVGCSKPACYFCFNWLSNHKHQYTLPATHHKIIPACRGPDNDINEAGAIVLKEMYTKICKGLDQDILGFLSSEHGGSHSRRQYMSTEGSSRATSRIS